MHCRARYLLDFDLKIRSGQVWVFCVLHSTPKKTKKNSITNGLPCIIYASTRNFRVGKESAQQSTKVHFDDFSSRFLEVKSDTKNTKYVNIHEMNCFNNQSHPKFWQFLTILTAICYQIWILKIISLKETLDFKMQQLAIEQDFLKKHLFAVT